MSSSRSVLPHLYSAWSFLPCEGLMPHPPCWQASTDVGCMRGTACGIF